MQPYDEKAWRQIDERRQRIESRRARNILPERVREVGREVADRGKDAFEQFPGSEHLQQVLDDAMRGAVSTIGTAAAASVSQRAVLRRYQRLGCELARVEDIQGLDLETSGRAYPRRKRLLYITGSAAQGGAAGAASLVMEAGALAGGVAGAGAGAVPGALALAGVLVADAAATLGAAARIVAETAALYGYDPNDPEEELFLAGVLSVATAGSQGAKITAHRELNHVASLLARRATKKTLSETNLARVLSKVWPRLVDRLTHQQMGKATPALGIAVGAGLNANLMKRVSEEAYYAYRERRLRDRYGNDEPGTATPAWPSGDPGGDPGAPLILDLVDEGQTTGDDAEIDPDDRAT